MDPMTQSAQISSSQGFADGHNSAAKESKLSDSFLSSSPVSLIQSPQDKRVGSDKNSDLEKTPLNFSQSASSISGNYDMQSDEPPDSPIKTSPVSERIKALEALVAKKKEPDFRSDGYSHYRDRHTDKRSSIEIQKAAFEKNEKTTTTAQKKGSSSDKDSPDSPFEILGDCKPLKELEDTEEWMKSHLPPMPNFQSSDDISKEPPVFGNVSSEPQKEHPTPDAPASFVPDAFMDSPTKSFDDAIIPQNPYAEEECDFDLSFLPTAYMCNQQEKNYDAMVPVSPPAGFESKSPPTASPEHVEKTQFTVEPDPPEAAEVDSSGESDDTVIEDGVPVHSSVQLQSTLLKEGVDSTSVPSNVPKDEKEVPPAKTERKLMQVPTINVIETDEPNYSDEEMELEVEEDEEDKETQISKEKNVKRSDSIPESSVEKIPEEHALENQFVEGYSPPSSPVESDTEFSPKHKAHGISDKAVAEGPQEPQPIDDFMVPSKGNLTDKELAEEFSDHDDEWGDQTVDVAKLKSATPNPGSFTKHEMDEKASAEVMETQREAHNPKSSFIRDELYDRESFDYDYDAPPSPDDDGEDSEPDLAIDQPCTNLVNPELNTSQSTIENDTIQDNLSKRYPQDPYSIFYTAPVSSSEPDVDNETQNVNLDDNCNTIKGHETETQHMEPEDLISETKGDPCDLDHASNSEPADSFVEFMRECLKSRQDEETHHAEDRTSNLMQDVNFSPNVATDLEQEKLTISALKELGSSQEDETELPLQSEDLYQVESSITSTKPSSQPPCPPNTQPSSSLSDSVSNSTYVREVEAIDEWVAEAYHLAEHVLTAVLTHLSVKDLIHWRDPKKSGVVFGVSMLLLLSLAAFSVISVISYLLLALLCVTITFRIYKSVVQAVQKSNEGHPFKSLIEKDVSIPPETFRKHVDASLTYINRALKQLSRLFLVEDLVDSLKLAVVMWLLTYVGAVFNGITILILADILLFAVPPVYEKNKTQIDQYIDVARTQINTTMAKLQEKLPGAMKRTKSE